MYAVVLASFMLPAMTETPYSPADSGLVVMAVITTAFPLYRPLAPLIHVSTVLVLALLYLDRERGVRVADLYFTALYIFIAFSNNIAVTEDYGLTILTSNLIPMLIVAMFWLWESYRPQNHCKQSRLPPWRYWVIPFAFLAFWFPVSSSGGPDFSPLLLLTSDYGIAFCPTTPVVVAILTLMYPRVNHALLSATSLVGLVIGAFNMLAVFLIPGYTVWLVILHLPLVLIALYGLLLPKLISPSKSGQSSTSTTHD